MVNFSNVPINFEDIPHAEEVQLRPIDKKHLWVKLVNTILFYLILALIAIGFYMFDKTPPPFFDEYLHYVLLGLALVAILSVLMAVMGFKYKGYAIREKDIIFQSGLIFRKVIHVPFNRVQHAEVNQGVLDRYLDLAKLKVFTAGGSKSDLSIPGLINQDALDMKAFILNKTEEDESI